MRILFILNEAPYGSEKSYNALRLAMALQKDQPGTEVIVFLWQMLLRQRYLRKPHHRVITMLSAC